MKNKRITVKSVKVYKSLSRETLCFVASLYFDGKRVGQVSNRGAGGSNFYESVPPSIMKAMREYAKTFPEKSVEHNGGTFTVSYDLDLVVAEAVDEYDLRKRLKPKKNWVFERKDRTGNFVAVSKSLSLEKAKKLVKEKYSESYELCTRFE